MLLIIDKEEMFDYIYNAIRAEGYIIHDSVLEAMIDHGMDYITKSVEQQQF